MKSKKIDFSDIPELSDKQLSRMRRVGRPTVEMGRESSSLSVWMRKCCRGYARPPRKRGNHTNHSSTKYWPRRCAKRVRHYSLPRFRNSGNVEVWSDRIRDRHVASSNKRSARSARALSECSRTENGWNYWNAETFGTRFSL